MAVWLEAEVRDRGLGCGLSGMPSLSASHSTAAAAVCGLWPFRHNECPYCVATHVCMRLMYRIVCEILVIIICCVIWRKMRMYDNVVRIKALQGMLVSLSIKRCV